MPARIPAYLPSPTPARFRSQLGSILGDARLIWLPQANDTTTGRTFETSTGRVVTYDATVAARLSRLGRGMAQSFSSAGSQFGSTPDTDNLSFGNGTADSAVSGIALVNVTDTAAVRAIVTKYDTSNIEWRFIVDVNDKLNFVVTDNSAGVEAFRVSDSAITQGSWRLFGFSYDGRGGATAADGMTLYQDGAVIASTASNNAGYVAMENLTAAVEIGSRTAHTAHFFDGSMALVAVAQKNMSTNDHGAVLARCRRFFGVPT